MQRIRVLLAAGMLLAILISIPAVYAQGDDDGDGLPNNVDDCPNQAGPRENRGCPVDVPADPAPAPVGDQDGDGMSDDVDFCPQDAGPESNGGCPLPQEVDAEPTVPEAVEIALPTFPETTDCLLATAGPFFVNVRMLPFDTAPIVGSLDPLQLYPRAYDFINPDGERWYGTTNGLVASWVTRTNPCRGIPTYSYATGDDGTTTFMLASQIMLPADLVGFNPQPEPPPNWQLIFPEDTFPFPQTREHVLLARFSADGMPVGALSLMHPAILEALQTESDVTILLPGDLVGFNPQPEPPPGSLFVFPGDLVGFNPQPEPPGDQGALMGDGSVMPQFKIMLMLAEDGSVQVMTEVYADPAMDALESCDTSLGDAACLHTAADGSVAVCFPSDADMVCAYSFPPEPIFPPEPVVPPDPITEG